MMKAAWYERNGAAAEVLQFGDRPTPEPGPGEVRIRLAYSGVNPSDVKSRAGSRPVSDLYIIPHSDGAGVIDQVGAGVDPARVGQRVWTWNAQYGRPLGTCAQYVALPENQAVFLPTRASMQEGACLGIPALTAYQAVELAEIEAGHVVLVIGGASAVNFYAAQMARERGARVICTVGSQAKADLLREAGFDELILYKEQDVAREVLKLTGSKGVNAIIDMDFSTSAALIEQGVLASHGQFVCFGSNDRGWIPVSFGALLPRSISLKFFLVYELTEKQRKVCVEGVNRLLEQGVLQHLSGPCFALEEIVAAHEAVESGKEVGKVLVHCE
ncbi:NADPH:quinone reductase [Orrella marina]|nr:NADPH:quinone reductase [Orrella marina]